MFKLDLEKAEEPEIKLPTSVESLKKQESSRKISTSALLTTPKPLTMWITTNCGKFFKRWEYQMETMPGFFFFLTLKSLQMVIAAMKLRHLLLGRKVMTNLDSLLKSRDITLPANVHLVKAMAFPAVMYERRELNYNES